MPLHHSCLTLWRRPRVWGHVGVVGDSTVDHRDSRTREARREAPCLFFSGDPLDSGSRSVGWWSVPPAAGMRSLNLGERVASPAASWQRSRLRSDKRARCNRIRCLAAASRTSQRIKNVRRLSLAPIVRRRLLRVPAVYAAGIGIPVQPRPTPRLTSRSPSAKLRQRPIQVNQVAEHVSRNGGAA